MIVPPGALLVLHSFFNLLFLFLISSLNLYVLYFSACLFIPCPEHIFLAHVYIVDCLCAMLTCTSVQVKYGNYLDEGLGAVADVNVSLVTRLILHITDTQLPVSLVCVK